jgi:hypothetical protein
VVNAQRRSRATRVFARDAPRLEALDLARGQTWYALPAAAARLDALAALKERSLVECDAPPLLQPGTYLEPFALP